MTTLRIGHTNRQHYIGVDDVALLPGAPTVSGGLLNTAGWVWDTIGLAWIKATPSSGGGGGGGTQYAEGTTVATATGTIALAKTPSNVTTALKTDASGNLNVNLAAGSISGGNAAASPTGAAVPASADYTGWNSGGTLTGVTLTTALPVQPGTGVVFPVSGTFWQATQPVSIAASVAVTGTFWQATQPVSGSLGRSWTLSNVTDSIAVSGTFWQATQPVSIASMPSTPVTGTFWQATQPVSISTTVNTSDGHTAANTPLSVRLTDGTSFYTASGGGGGGSTFAQANAVAPTWTEGQNANLSQDLSGQLRVRADALDTFNQTTMKDLLTGILVELRTLSELTKQGLNVRDELDTIRNDVNSILSTGPLN